MSSLGPLQLRVLRLLIKFGACSVGGLRKLVGLRGERLPAHTTILTVCQRLHRAGLVIKEDTDAKADTYRSALSQEQLEALLIKRFVEDCFEGDPDRLRRALNHNIDS